MSAHRSDLDAEQELDVSALWVAVTARWWLPLAGLVAGAIIGYVVAFGGTSSYSAQALVYLGQPLAPGGGAQLQSLATNPATVTSIIRSEAVIRDVSAKSGLPPSQLRNQTTVHTVAVPNVRQTQSSLVTITVKGGSSRKTAIAANAFGRQVVTNVSGYVAGKIASLRARALRDAAQEKVLQARLAIINAALTRKNLSTTDQLIVSGQAASTEQELGATQQDELLVRQLLSLAQNVEASRIVTRAVAAKSSGPSRRNYIVVGLFVGLVIGLLAAVLWEPALRASRRPAA